MSLFNFQNGLRILALLITSLILSACTTMKARLSLDPYTKDKQKRNAIELIAEEYCAQKRNYPGTTAVQKQPDFIFTTDGCSRVPDDGWVECCIVHDILYWCGGSEEDRAAADQFLKQCLNKKKSFFAGLFYLGTRVGGVPWLPTPWRWGYGWEDWPRGYESLEDSPSTIQLLENLHIEQEVQKHLQEYPLRN